MPTKEEALLKIQSLVQRFDEQKEFYQNTDYNETQTRRDFIDPFWKALGWDVDNESGVAESYREVRHEDRVIIGGVAKAPDYSFRLSGGKRLFFLEAKKPSVDIDNKTEPAYQIRRYGRSAKMAISVLTNFEKFAVYDCSFPPKHTDKASTGRITNLTYTDYVSEFDFLWNTFSKESVLKGGFDRFIKSDTNKKGTTTVDDDFLLSLDTWRMKLAQNIVLRNEINEDQLNFVVQNTIDRIVFLRFAEDRGIERYGNLQKAIKTGDYYQNLLRLFRIAEQKYDSGLFDFGKDKISAKISIDDKVIKSIISEFYFPVCPYEFSILPVEILGTAYERFLGKRIVLSQSGRRARVEEKPEVRKSGGVYYTPQYIVDYIVHNTVGQLLEGKTPKEVSKIRIVDPACGSGSFLIGAYQYLLNWHKDYCTRYFGRSKGHKGHPLTPNGELTTAEKKRILLNNIYGVDLDSNAVEVTKLSLLLKFMENETNESIESQRKLFHDRVLPDLDENIKSGNSLIDIDYYENELDFGEERKIKPFSWQKNFPDVFKQGGFDCVIGNPPWVSLNGKFGHDILSSEAQQYLISKYHGNTSMPNLYEYFVHRGLELINDNGLFSLIVPDRLGFNNQFVTLRKKLLQHFKVEELIYKVPFPGIVADTLIFRCTKKTKKSKNHKIAVGEFETYVQFKTAKEYLQDNECRFFYESSDNASKVLNRIFGNKKCKPLGHVAETTSGFGGKSSEITETRKTKKQIEVIKGRSIQRFSSVTPYYFDFKKEHITGRTTDRKKLGVKEKVLLRKTGLPIIATYDESGIYPEQSLYFIFNNQTNSSLKYFTALINSKLFQFVYINRLVTNKDSISQLKKVDLDKFPVFICSDKSEKQKHDEIVKHVDKLLQLYQDMPLATLPSHKERIQSNIDYCEDRINSLVYELYELTDTEIAIIEGEKT